MAIRMEKDQPDPRQPRKPERDQPNRPEDPEKKRKGGTFPLWYLALALFAIIKKPKWLITIAVILGIYFVLRSFLDVGGAPGGVSYEASTDQFSYGATLNEAEYDKAMVYEPLSVGAQNRMPVRVDLTDFAPKPLHQGRQGSCSGWACAYGARTISYARATGADPDRSAFSPSFLYNQIARPGCQGAFLRDAMEAMKSIGSLPFSDFGYTDQTCRIAPDLSQRGAATNYRIKGYTRLSRGPGDYSTNAHSVKQHLAQGAPVVIGMLVGSSFQQGMMGRELWRPTRADYQGVGLGGHAMCLIGYDDQKAGGAFKVLNSWGTRWGNNGYAWITYDDFDQFAKEAFGIYPEGSTKKFDANRLEAAFALVENESQRIIPLQQTGEITFRTTSTLRKGSKFKIAITNEVECYAYVFGMEADGRNSVLFPYTEKHSPYFGITGTRLFPKDYSMTLDQVGNRDRMAIVISKKPINYQVLNRQINQNRSPEYMMRVVESLAEDFVPECDFQVEGSVAFDCATRGKNVLAVIVEVDKR